jgi:hypothetical protein
MIRTTKLVIVAMSALLVIVLMSVYFVQNIYSNNDKNVYSSVCNGLQVCLTVNETTHRQGENIYVTLTLTNVNNQNVSTAFIRGEHFELNIYDSKNELEAAKISGEGFKPITLAPKSSITETFNWLTDAPYYYPPEGVYQFVGLIADPNGQSVFRTAPLKITLIKELTTTPSS